MYAHWDEHSEVSLIPHGCAAFQMPPQCSHIPFNNHNNSVVIGAEFMGKHDVEGIRSLPFLHGARE